MNDFIYSKDKINAMIDEYLKKGMKRAEMAGVHDDLVRLKAVIEKIYEEDIFYLSYFSTDAPYMGWTGKELSTMLQITDGITQKFKEIYALILCGLGEKLE